MKRGTGWQPRIAAWVSSLCCAIAILSACAGSTSREQTDRAAAAAPPASRGELPPTSPHSPRGASTETLGDLAMYGSRTSPVGVAELRGELERYALAELGGPERSVDSEAMVLISRIIDDGLAWVAPGGLTQAEVEQTRQAFALFISVVKDRVEEADRREVAQRGLLLGQANTNTGRAAAIGTTATVGAGTEPTASGST